MAESIRVRFTVDDNGFATSGPHTWMDSEDIEFDPDVEMPTTPDEWAALGMAHPCACPCTKAGPGHG